MIDIGHPAHVHYFRNLIKIMEERGHKFLVIAKNRNITYSLLDFYGIAYIKRAEYPRSLIGKLLNIPLTSAFVFYHAIMFKPDLLMGFSGTHIAHAGFLLGLPRIVIDDTEHAKLAHASYKPFASAILTPACFKIFFGKKHLKFNGYTELCYLHPKYFLPNKNIKKELGFGINDKLVLVRFVDWRASHDIGQQGISFKNKIELIERLAVHCNIIISSEKPLPESLTKFAYNLHPSKIHDVQSVCDLFIGEGVTMASECAVLGTPAIYINSLELGYTTDQENKYRLVFNYRTFTGVIDKAIELITDDNLQKKSKLAAKKLIADHINVTDFLVWFVETYPNSKKAMQESPDIQYQFK
jgi:uncharacterized protein